MKIYLDNCCFNRPFDVQTSLRVHLETLAKLSLQSQIRDGEISLVWSYVLDYEISKNPFEDRKESILPWIDYADEIVAAETESILTTAETLQRRYRFKIFDALHIACAIETSCDYFVTTDDQLLKSGAEEINIVNPVELSIM